MVRSREGYLTVFFVIQIVPASTAHLTNLLPRLSATVRHAYQLSRHEPQQLVTQSRPWVSTSIFNDIKKPCRRNRLYATSPRWLRTGSHRRPVRSVFGSHFLKAHPGIKNSGSCAYQDAGTVASLRLLTDCAMRLSYRKDTVTYAG